MNRLLQSLAVWIGLGMTASALGLDITNSLFWCLLILIWVAEILARAEGREQGQQPAQKKRWLVHLVASFRMSAVRASNSLLARCT